MNEPKTLGKLYNEGKLGHEYWRRPKGSVYYYDIGYCTPNGKIRAFGYRKTRHGVWSRVTHYLPWDTKFIEAERDRGPRVEPTVEFPLRQRSERANDFSRWMNPTIDS